MYFSELFRNAANKVEVITTFLALLELIRLKEIVVKQSNVFGDIVIERNTELMQPIPKEQDKES
jgi:segregation and condensation protein A